MPSIPHELPLALFRQCPELVAELLRDVLAVELPAYREVRALEADFTQLVPTEFRADLVLALEDETPRMGIVVEVQRQVDARKRYTWPLYVTALRARLERPALLLVFCEERPVAAWASEPIRIGPGATFQATVLGPERVPWVRTAEEARRLPELAVLSAVAHGNEEEGLGVVLAAIEAVVMLDEERRNFYTDVVMASLNEAARRALEREMETRHPQVYSEFGRAQFAKGRAEGRGEGRVEEGVMTLLAVLGARGMNVDDETRARITECTDLERLRRWVVRAVNAGSLEEVFRDE